PCTVELMSRMLPLALALAVVSLTGAACARYATLEPARVASLGLRLGDPGGTVCVNDGRARVVAEVVYRDGKRVETWNGEGSRRGKLRLHDLTILADPVGIDEVGRMAFPPDPKRWLDRPLIIQARVPDRPIAIGLTVTPRYDCGGVGDYSGAVGRAGGTGEDGGPGAPGPSVRVALAWIDTVLNGRLLLVRVTRGDEPPRYHLVDTRAAAARFEVSAAGGAGGAGGAGSSGWGGSDGTDGSSGFDGGTCQDGSSGGAGGNGSDGQNGDDGADGGDGGDGGTIVVEAAPGDADLVRLIGYRTGGGPAGAAGGGGSGGSGGDGGDGGSGGRAGSTTDEDGDSCHTSDGTDGTDGTDGSDGWPGHDGRPGRPGPNGTVLFHPLDPSSAWTREIAAGMRIVTGPAGPS
ncbi:MAG TPA: hypothetical protein VK698_33555, partial [Kofleriaceae bacterium]|nr:hypothetical protein [Kofleriaceae bacterium]